MNLLWIGLGGALGAISRYGVASLFRAMGGSYLVLATVLVNVVGCFLIGLAMAMLDRSGSLEKPLLFFGVVGFLGSFTTFSAFGLETVSWMKGGQWGLAIGNVVLSVGLGLAAVAIGLKFK